MDPPDSLRTNTRTGYEPSGNRTPRFFEFKFDSNRQYGYNVQNNVRVTELFRRVNFQTIANCRAPDSSPVNISQVHPSLTYDPTQTSTTDTRSTKTLNTALQLVKPLFTSINQSLVAWLQVKRIETSLGLKPETAQKKQENIQFFSQFLIFTD